MATDIRDVLPADEKREILTYSSDRSFVNCRMLYNLRNVERLESREEEPEPLFFGTLFHKMLAHVHRGMDYHQAEYAMRPELKPLWADPAKKKWALLLHAMVEAYVEQMPRRKFLTVEEVFWGEIENPDTTTGKSKTFIFAGRVDGIIQDEEGYWLDEEKSTSKIDTNYLEKLWTDFQTTIYIPYIETWLGIQIAGVEYGISEKCGLKQKGAETEAEFEERRAALLAKSKTGKTTAARWIGELDVAYLDRMREWYREPGHFVRQRFLVDRKRINAMKAELWEHTQAILDAKRRGMWYQNPSQCWAFNRPCEMWRLCSSGFDQAVRETFYQPRKELHPELIAERSETHGLRQPEPADALDSSADRVPGPDPVP